MKKRIAFFLPSLGGGGAERVALTSAIDLANRGHQVDLVLIQAKGELMTMVPPEVRVIDLNKSRIFSALRPLIRYFREERPHAFHALMWPVTVVAILAHRLANSPARLMVSDHVAYSQPFLNKRQMLLLRITVRLFYPFADYRIVVSERAAEDLSRLSGISRNRFEVIYNPVSPPANLISTKKIEELWGNTHKRILTVGSLKDQKNHTLLLHAFSKIEDRDTKLLILGEGQLRSKLEKLAIELGVAERVLMPGFSVNPWPYLVSADVFVLSSDYEGFPVVLAEAMHVGLRVISTDCVSGPAEMLGNGRFGKLVPCGDISALAIAIDQTLVAPRNRDVIRRRAEDLTGPKVLSRYAELLTGIDA